jgi:hypothetical protein
LQKKKRFVEEEHLLTFLPDVAVFSVRLLPEITIKHSTITITHRTFIPSSDFKVPNHFLPWLLDTEMATY